MGLNMLKKLKTYNKFFIQNTFMGDLENNKIFDYEERFSQICLTAPHATKTIRNNEIKKSDLYTGAICKLLGEIHNVSYIIRNKFTPQKSSLTEFIIQNNLTERFFIDIHGMKADVDFELAVGIGNLSSNDYDLTLNIIDKICKKYSISYIVNHPNYTGRFGLTGKLQAHTKKANVIQLEWRKDMRDFMNNWQIVKTKTIPFLSELVMEINDS